MVSANYKQTLSLKITKKQRVLQIVGISLQALSITFGLIGILVNFYYYIGFLLMYSAGVVVYQFYYMAAREYEYILTENQLIFAKKDIRLHSKVMLTLQIADIVTMKTFSDVVKGGELVAIDDVGRLDAKEIEYKKDDASAFVIFAPDEYMLALLEDRIERLK